MSHSWFGGAFQNLQKKQQPENQGVRERTGRIHSGSRVWVAQDGSGPESREPGTWNLSPDETPCTLDPDLYGTVIAQNFADIKSRFCDTNWSSVNGIEAQFFWIFSRIPYFAGSHV